MAYCRFSTDDYKCDVYVYYGGNYILHVASRKRDFTNVEFPPKVSIGIDPGGWYHRIKAVGKILDKCEFIPIDHPDAGKTFEFCDPGECAEKLISLAAEGLYIPEDAILALVEEQAEIDMCCIDTQE